MLKHRKLQCDHYHFSDKNSMLYAYATFLTKFGYKNQLFEFFNPVCM